MHQLDQFLVAFALLFVLHTTEAAVQTPNGYDDDYTPLQLNLEELEREQVQRFNLNNQPPLPTHYEWHPSVAASVPPSHFRDATKLEQAEHLRQLQQPHHQLSAGYALPTHLPGGPLHLQDGSLSPASAFAAAIPITTKTIAATKTPTRLLQPIMPFDLDLQLHGVQYLNSNALPSFKPLLPRPGPRPVARPVRPTYIFPQQQRQQLATPLRANLSSQTNQATPLFQLSQSKQCVYAPVPQRNYESSERIPLPFPPSFVTITNRRPTSSFTVSYTKPLRPSQPDLFTGLASKTLLESYIPSWEVLRLYQQYQSERPMQRQTLAYAVPSQRIFKRDSLREPVDSSRIAS